MRDRVMQFTGYTQAFLFLRYYGFPRECQALPLSAFRSFKPYVLRRQHKNNGYDQQGKEQEKEKRIPLSGIGQTFVNTL
jgi:hypothetical protein